MLYVTRCSPPLAPHAQMHHQWVHQQPTQQCWACAQHCNRSSGDNHASSCSLYTRTWPGAHIHLFNILQMYSPSLCPYLCCWPSIPYIACSTRYHHNYSVKANIQTYDTHCTAPEPVFLQVSTHFFIEMDLCERFMSQMAMAWYALVYFISSA